MTRLLEQQLAKVSGVVIPSKLPEGQSPLKAPKSHPIDTNLDKASSKSCPICGHTVTRSSDVRWHFVACVKMNGNPTGARWDDDVNVVPRPHLGKRKLSDLDQSADTDTPSASKRTARAQKTAEQREERQRRYYERLRAVNGVVIPSKLAAGVTPVPKNYKANGNGKYPCVICGRLHPQKYHVQSHFAVCVEANGNPTGARWDDAWNGVGARTTAQDGEVEDNNMQRLQLGNCETACAQSDDALMEGSPLDDNTHHESQSVSLPSDEFALNHPVLGNFDLQLASPSSSDFEPYHPGLEELSPQLTSPSSAGFEPYHPDLKHLDQ